MTSTPRPTPTTPPTPAVSPTLTWTAPPLPESGFWDDFDGAVGENWKWYYPDEDYVSLELAPGKLRIYPQSGGLPSGNPRNLLLANAPQDDYEISTFLAFTPESNYQFAGLLILNDLNNALQFGVGYAECTDPLNCLGRALYFTSFQDGAPSEQTIATLANDTDQIYLRLQRQGKNYRAEYSLDGLEWLQAGVLTNPLTPNWVGLTAGQSESGYNPEIFADFDYFSLSLLP
jgi:regulation of enolase protein 1 (concanavalin A-like superfamily)